MNNLSNIVLMFILDIVKITIHMLQEMLSSHEYRVKEVFFGNNLISWLLL